MKKITIILISLLFIILPLIIIKFLYPTIGFDHVKFSEEYLKLLGSAVFGLCLGFSTRIIDKSISAIESRKKIIESAKEYKALITPLILDETINNESKLSKAFSPIKDNLINAENNLKNFIFNYSTLIIIKQNKFNKNIAELKFIIDGNTCYQIDDIEKLKEHLKAIQKYLITLSK